MNIMHRVQVFSGLLLGILLTLGLTGCGNSPLMTADAATGSPAATPQSDSQTGGTLTVSVVKPERKMLRRRTTQPATVSAYYEADIHAKVAGYLTELKHDIGDEVKAGEVLGIVSIPELDKQKERRQAEIRKLVADEKRAAAEVQVARSLQTAAEADWKQAQAEVGKSEALVVADRRELVRTQDLVQRQSVADRLLDESQKRFESSEAAQKAAEAAVSSAAARLTVAQSKIAAAQAEQDAAGAQTDVARKQLEELEALINYATLTAPFAGIVTARNVDLGDLVRNTQTASAGDRLPLFSVAQVETVRVRVQIPENDAPWADAGDAASIRLRAVPGPAIEAQLTRISGSLDPSTRTMTAEMELKNQDRKIKLLPGMFGEVTITLADATPWCFPPGWCGTTTKATATFTPWVRTTAFPARRSPPASTTERKSKLPPASPATNGSSPQPSAASNRARKSVSNSREFQFLASRAASAAG